MSEFNEKVLLMIGEIRADQRSMKRDVAEIKKQVSEVRDFKISVVSWCTAAAGGVTFLIAAGKAAILTLLKGDL